MAYQVEIGKYFVVIKMLLNGINALGYLIALWLMHRSLVLAYTRLIITILRGEYVLTILSILTLFCLLLYLIFF